MLYFNTFSEFLAMGGHGFYVWLSYLIVAVAMILQFSLAKSALGKTVASLSRYYSRKAKAQSKSSTAQMSQTTPQLNDFEEV